MQNIDLNEIAVFLKVAQLGSFTTAAKQLGMPNSTVSAKISSLESRLALTLILRTTRKLSLTPAGRAYFENCQAGMEGIVRAEEMLSSSHGEPKGPLKITVPGIFATSLLTEIVSKFIQKFPKVELELILSDRMVDLVAEGVDLAIRASELKDSSFIMKKLGATFFATYASPAYLKRNAAPTHPKDLSRHACLQFSMLGREHWDFSNGKSKVRVNLPGKILVDDLSLIHELAVNGNGIAYCPTFSVVTK